MSALSINDVLDDAPADVVARLGAGNVYRLISLEERRKAGELAGDAAQLLAYLGPTKPLQRPVGVVFSDHVPIRHLPVLHARSSMEDADVFFFAQGTENVRRR